MREKNEEETLELTVNCQYGFLVQHSPFPGSNTMNSFQPEGRSPKAHR